ncbi:Uma2 family endonuclease [Micromonospora sp. WMMD956]|uniref:Uma2 family endonuclease n=1 Tax=Micromonospora TaxID=1873 RepID=UPI002415B150|nr:Uma2 family endonuclease [Micromonospora sp. WMMD956]MDG4814382.1 Uma2 family endonuclease [Micromonospora sp. WMMD956]
MSAEPIPTPPGPWCPDPIRQQRADYTLEDGIPFYWRVEQDPVHVYAYRLSDRLSLGGERQYELVADNAELIALAEPFEIKLPVAELTG